MKINEFSEENQTKKRYFNLRFIENVCPNRKLEERQIGFIQQVAGMIIPVHNDEY